MVYRPFSKFSRYVLAACAVSLGVGNLNAQTPPAAAPMGINPSRVDYVFGYSYFGSHGQLKPSGINYSSINVGRWSAGHITSISTPAARRSWSIHPNGKNDGLYSIRLDLSSARRCRISRYLRTAWLAAVAWTVRTR